MGNPKYSDSQILSLKFNTETQKTTTPATTNVPNGTSIRANTTADNLVSALFRELSKLEERQGNRSIGHANALAEDSKGSKKEEDGRNINGSTNDMQWRVAGENKDVVNQYAEEQKGSANKASRDPFSQFSRGLDAVKCYSGLIILAVFLMYYTLWHVYLGKI